MTIEDFDQLATYVGNAEGLRLKAYQDTKGVWTIGYGMNLQELEIDQATAQQWLYEKLAQCQKEADATFPWFAALTVRRQQAVIELTYNLGLTKLRKFVRFLAAMAAKDYPAARAELIDSNWHTDVGEVRAGRIETMILQG